jgi:uncharacterized membrane protein
MNHDSNTTVGRLKQPLRYVMGFFYLGAGVMHFIVPKAYAQIVPPQLPQPVTLVYLSGVAEVVLGIGVLVRRTRRRAAWGLIVLLLAVFPANVHMATHEIIPEAVPDWADGIARVVLWVRLPLQGVLLLWAWWYTRPTPENDCER